MPMDSTPIIIKKVKAHSHPHHGGSWKVAYADFVTAMMAFFMVLWIMGLSDQTRTQVAGYFNDPLGFAKTEPKSDNAVAVKSVQSPKSGATKTQGKQGNEGKKRKAAHKLEKELKEKLSHMKSPAMKKFAGATDIVETPDGTRIEFAETKDTEFFQVGSAEFTPAAREFISGLAPIFAGQNQEMAFEGFTDARPYGKGAEYDNYDLSVDRAKALKHLLFESKVPSKLFAGVRGYGSQDLKFPGDPYASENRRVAILVNMATADAEKKVNLTKDLIKEELGPSVNPDAPQLTMGRPNLKATPEKRTIF